MHSLHPLTQADLPALLDFERHNRAYFEQWVPPRPAWDTASPKRHTAKGLASAAVLQICVIVRQTHAHSGITALAARCNPASQRVLTKNGFTKTRAPAQEAMLNGQPIWLEHFHKPL